AYDQLKQLSERIGVEFLGAREGEDPVEVARKALEKRADVYIFDTAGRSALDPELIEELKRIKEAVIPEKTLLVIPADMGQVAGREAREFAREIGIDGVIISKLDGSGKGGGALSACKEAGVPVYFVGTGEGVDDLEEFDAERFVARLLGVPDFKALMERFRGKEEELEEILKGKYDINAFYKQLKAFNEMGPLDKVLQMLGISSLPDEMMEVARKKFKKYDAIYKSMTKQERAHPEILNESRMRRIARGSGTSIEDVRSFLKDYKRAKKMFERLKKARNVEKLLRRLRM
ncbi:MAG: signal recognition particle protein Srp19, partial [Candidatus Diapherotrites archaeon]|nr:signal recognition particle protein Srp19 [Candidatus Diapherotrites archaeon]